MSQNAVGAPSALESPRRRRSCEAHRTVAEPGLPTTSSSPSDAAAGTHAHMYCCQSAHMYCCQSAPHHLRPTLKLLVQRCAPSSAHLIIAWQYGTCATRCIRMPAHRQDSNMHMMMRARVRMWCVEAQVREPSVQHALSNDHACPLSRYQCIDHASS